MRPIEKTSEDLFQKLRSRFSPVSMGDEDANETATPSEARIFNFMFKDGETDAGYVSISIIDNRSFKIYYGTDLEDKIENKDGWYRFLKELRMFAKRNLMSFDARDLAKNQLEPRDFKFISSQDKTYKEHEVTVSESVMFGSRRKSYQTMENVKMIVNHRKSIDETIPGARSRYIESIYLERADGERYKFPYNYLTGARAMARHVNEGGNPYDDMGKHIIGMIKEMRDLSKFARRTKKHAMEDENAGSIRTSVVERFHNMKKQLGAMSVKEGYSKFVENFKDDETLSEDDTIQQLKERFTQQVFDTQLEDTLPAVIRAIKEAEMRQVAEADKSVEKLIKTMPLVLRKDSAADQMFRTTKFTDGSGLLGFILSDIASRAIGDDADVVANFASDAAERIQDKDYDPNDKQLAMQLAKKYMDDVKKMMSDPGYADQIRADSKDIYGAKKKRTGGFHEAEQYEAWASELVPENDLKKKSHDEVGEATTQGTQGTQGTGGPSNPGQVMRDPKLQQAAKNVSRVAQAAGIKAPPNQIAQTMAAQATGKPPNRQGMMAVGGLGNTIMQAAASDPRKAAQLTAMMKKMVTQGKFDEDAVRRVLEEPNTTTVYKTPGTTPPPKVSSVINDPKNQTSTAFKVPGSTPPPASKLSGADALKALSVGLGPKGDLEPGAMGKVTLPVQPLKQFDKTQSAMPDMDAMVGQEKATSAAASAAKAAAQGTTAFTGMPTRTAPLKTIPANTGAARANAPVGSMPAAKIPSIPANTGAARANIPVGSMPAAPPSGTVAKGGNVWNTFKSQFGRAPTQAELSQIAKSSGIKDINKVMPGQKLDFSKIK
jgi:hypothetical protein